MPPLDQHEQDLLAFERDWWRQRGAKSEVVRERFGLSPDEYHRSLAALLDRDEALEHDAVLVRRLRRMRGLRRQERARSADSA